MIPANKKNKIELSDYNFQKDIESRIFLSSLSLFEADLLREIIYSSLKFPLSDLTSLFSISEAEIHPFLLRLKEIKLLDFNKNEVIVDKDLRRYYEIQIEKLDESFEPSLEYIQSLLNQIPMNVLPNWYAIPKTADGFFDAIIEKTFATPKIYQKYLQEIQFEEPLLESIAKEVFKAPGYSVTTAFLKEKYQLTQRQLEEALLVLEFNFVCFLTFKPVDGRFEEFVTPFSEWKRYLEFTDKVACKAISSCQPIEKTISQEFGFVESMKRCLMAIPEMQGLLLSDIENIFEGALSFNKILDKITSMNLAIASNNIIKLTEKGKAWLKEGVNSQAMHLYMHSIGKLRAAKCPALCFSDRDAREVEKCLKSVLNSGWIYFDDFLMSLTGSIGKSEAISLQKKGKRWSFHFPSYSEDEKDFIKDWIFEHLFFSGMVETGRFQNKFCFKVTTFGKLSFGDE